MNCWHHSPTVLSSRSYMQSDHSTLACSARAREEARRSEIQVVSKIMFAPITYATHCTLLRGLHGWGSILRVRYRLNLGQFP
jgi:hypothetical protein